jgi:hypothetical protein
MLPVVFSSSRVLAVVALAASPSSVSFIWRLSQSGLLRIARRVVQHIPASLSFNGDACAHPWTIGRLLPTARLAAVPGFSF